MPRATVARSIVEGAIHAVAASTIGLVGLPFVFARPDLVATGAWMWLVLGTATGVWLIGLAPAFAGGLRQFLARLSARTGRGALEHQATVEISRLLLAAAYVVLLQAILRRPLVAVIGADAEPFVVEACLAAVALVVLLILLGQIHHAGRPLIEGLASSTLDALLATTGSDTTTHTDGRASGSASSPTYLAPSDQQAQPTLAGQTRVAATRVTWRKVRP
jgi:hypothetical protein